MISRQIRQKVARDLFSTYHTAKTGAWKPARPIRPGIAEDNSSRSSNAFEPSFTAAWDTGASSDQRMAWSGLADRKSWRGSRFASKRSLHALNSPPATWLCGSECPRATNMGSGPSRRMLPTAQPSRHKQQMTVIKTSEGASMLMRRCRTPMAALMRWIGQRPLRTPGTQHGKLSSGKLRASLVRASRGLRPPRQRLAISSSHFLPKAAPPGRAGSAQAERSVPARSRARAPDRSRGPRPAARRMPPLHLREAEQGCRDPGLVAERRQGRRARQRACDADAEQEDRCGKRETAGTSSSRPALRQEARRLRWP